MAHLREWRSRAGRSEDSWRCGPPALLAWRSRDAATKPAASPPGMILAKRTGWGWRLGRGLYLRLGLAGCSATTWRGGDEIHVGGGWRKRVGFQLRLLLQL